MRQFTQLVSIATLAGSLMTVCCTAPGERRVTPMPPSTEVPNPERVNPTTERVVVRANPPAGTLDVAFRASDGRVYATLPFLPATLNGVPQVGLRSIEREGALILENASVQLTIERISDRAVGLTWSAIDATPHPFELRWRDNGDFYGGGERFHALNQRGYILPMASTDHPEPKGVISYKPVPFLMSTAGYGFWADTFAEGTFDLSATERHHVSLRYTADRIRLVLFAGPDFAAVLNEFTRVTGRPRVPPPWAFGPWKSRDVHHNREEILEDVEESRRLDLPASVLVIDSPWETGYNNFELNEAQFSDPEAMFARVRSLGFHVCFWLTPFVNTRNVTDMNGIDPGPTSTFAEAAAQGFFAHDPHSEPLITDWWKGQGALVDFTNPAAVDWWHGQLRKTLRWGARAFKCDDGEGNFIADAVFHSGDSAAMRNRYSLLYLDAMQQFVDRELNGDGVLLARSGYTGLQRHPFCWAGDNHASFSHDNGLPTVILAGQTAALSGIAFWGHDIAGYQGTPTKEVFIRWTQFGAFSPLMMIHMTSNLGPWDFDEETLAIYRRYAKLRVQLFPYIHEAALEASRSGMPIIRPMVLACPGDEPAARHIFQYLFGPDLLVAPLHEGGTRKTVYLPAGTWIDFWTGERIDGPQPREVDAPLDRLPLFVRSGALVEMIPADVDTLIPRTPEIDADVRCMDDRRVLQVWPGPDRTLQSWDGLFAETRSVVGRSSLTLRSDDPRRVEVQVRHHPVEDVTAEGAPDLEVEHDQEQHLTRLRLTVRESSSVLSWSDE